MPEVSLAWKRRTLVCTGPATYYVAVPVIGPVPPPAVARELIIELQQLCRDAAPSNGTRVRAVRGRVAASAAGGHHVSMYVTLEHDSGDSRRDGAYVASVLRSAARAITTAASTPLVAIDTSPLQRMPQADFRNPQGPRPPSPGTPQGSRDTAAFASATHDQQHLGTQPEPAADAHARPHDGHHS